MNLKKLLLLIFMAAQAGLILLSPIALGQPSDTIAVARFSTAIPGEVLPEGWHPYTFQNSTRLTHYTLVEDEGRVVLRARAAASTFLLAFIIYRHATDPGTRLVVFKAERHVGARVF